MKSILQEYCKDVLDYDEYCHSNGQVRPEYAIVHKLFSSIDPAYFNALHESAKLAFLNQGITYSLYDDSGTREAIFPFDLFPRIVVKDEWNMLEKGLIQRNKAINLFIKDVYNKQQVFKDKVVPKEIIMSSAYYLKQMEGFSPIGDVYTHICGTDLIRDKDGKYYVLEDNLRNPSGVSYVLSNRKTLANVFPKLFRDNKVQNVTNYAQNLLRTLESVCPVEKNNPVCVLLTPGFYNSAYYEHTLLAKLMGIELVEGRDLFVENDIVYMRTIGKNKRVDVIYRRIDDDFLDPVYFKKDSILGVSGVMDAYLKGNVTIVNAPGTGISDDKLINSFVPAMIKYYLDEDPIIHNVPTFDCQKAKEMSHIEANFNSMVVKPVDMSGGYGVEIVDRLTKEEQKELLKKIKSDPRNFIAQPKVRLSTHLTYIEGEETVEPRHVDLRTYTLMAKDSEYVLPGGLTRVALKKSSLIVNSSQGGGSKDTWVIV